LGAPGIVWEHRCRDMALSTESIQKAIVGVAQAKYPGSQIFPFVARGVANALVSWISNPLSVTVQGTAIGVAGAGTVQGKMLFPSPGGPFVVAGLQQAQVSGITSAGVGQAIGAGLTTVLNSSAQYSGTSAGVGTGSDISKVVRADSGSLQALLISNLAGANVKGLTALQFARGLSIGIANFILTGTGVGGVTGSASIVSASGATISVVF